MSQPEMSQVAPLSDRLSRELPELLELRRHLHAIELSGEEHQTAALVAGELRLWGGGCVRGWPHGRCG